MLAARVILFVVDMERMASFYETVVGLAPLPGDEDPAEFRSFDAGGIQLSLHVVPASVAATIELSDPPAAREGSAWKLVFRSDDVEADRARLAERGARMGPAKRFGALELCDGADPEGNVFQLSNRI